MTTLNYSPATGRGLPQALKVAQEAMQLPGGLSDSGRNADHKMKKGV